MVDIPIQTIGYLSALNPISYTAGDATNDHDFFNFGNELLIVKNGGGGAVQVTVSSVACSHGRTQDVVESVGAGTDTVIGPFPKSLFNQSNGKVNVLLDVDTGVELAVVRYTDRNTVE